MRYRPEYGPNLAQGEFLAKYSRAEAKIAQESARHVGLNAHNEARDGRTVRPIGSLRSCDRHRGAHPDARAAAWRNTAWGNRHNELLGHAPVSLGNCSVFPW